MRQRSQTPGHPIVGALSPSRAGDFLTCPLLYRYRSVDRLPERPGYAAARGTLVHEALDRLFDHPAPARTVDTAKAELPHALERLLEHDPEIAFAFVEDAEWPAPEPPAVPETIVALLLGQAGDLVDTYFTLEDPRAVTPVQREELLEVPLEDGLLLRGYVDRIDDGPDGLRVVDYKTGRSPGANWEQSAMFQLRFYALMVARTSGTVPARLQLFYLGNGEVLHYEPDPDDLRRFERKLRALWSTIVRCAERGDWRPRESGSCRFCSFQALCPAKGGEMPPLPGVGDRDTVDT